MNDAVNVMPKLEQIPADLVSIDDYERLARDYIPPQAYAYIAGGAADEVTLNNNRNGFERLALNPRVLADFSGASTRLTLLGQGFSHPILLAPVAYQKLAHPQGELASAEAAEAMATGFITSTLASVPLEEIAARIKGHKWFQLYFQESREFTLSLVRRAEQAGYSALVVTVDVPVTGLRHHEHRSGFSLPAGVQAVNLKDKPVPPQKQLRPGQSIILNGIMADAPGWSDLEWLQQQTQLPIVVKGIINPRDALRVAEMGLAGVVVSNHGGRSLDGLPATIDVLPAVRAALGPDFPILLDSGIRRGSDVFKAIALGANAVLIGRPQVYALAVAGALGVAHMIRLLREELEITMALSGSPTLASIGPESLYKL